MKAMEILGAVTTQATQALTTTAKASSPLKLVDSQFTLKQALPGLVAGVVGALLWPKHRVLGFLGAAAIAGNAYPLLKGDRARALDGLGIVGAGLAGSLAWKRHPAIGYIGASVLTATVVPLA